MNILKKLLDNLGDKWNKLPKDFPYMHIKKSSGLYDRVTIDAGCIYFHNALFRSDLPQKQVIALKGLEPNEVLQLIRSMGYEVELTADVADYLNVGVLALIEVYNQALDVTLSAFSSGTWQRLYPLYRALRQAEMDTDQAILQLNRDMAKGDWLDYWASFFSLQRNPGENDNNFIRRFTMWIFNPKTNNIALKELLSYRLQDTNIDVRDKAPAEFELIVDTKYIEDSSDLHTILSEAKGAGIRYFLNYVSPGFVEDYKSYVAGAQGKPFAEMDVLNANVKALFSETFPNPKETFSTSIGLTENYTLPASTYDDAFKLGMSVLGTGKLGNRYTASQDVVKVTLTKNGQIVSEKTY